MNEATVSSAYKFSLAACNGKTTGRWTDAEQDLFVEGKIGVTNISALAAFGRDWKKVSTVVTSRSSS